jgi:hypothetical protein
MAKEAKAVASRSRKQPRHRSPNYPAIDLEKGIDRVTSLYKSAKTHFIPVSVAQEGWGYKALSSVADQAVAALKAFGLVEIQGEGSKRELRVSENARRIILNSPDRQELLRQAALSPAVHKTVWEKYGDIGLPADDILRSYLVFDLKFNEASVDSFIVEFRHSLAYAKVTTDDRIVEVEEEDDDYELVRQEGFSAVVNPQPLSKSAPAGPQVSGFSEFPLLFPNSRRGVLQIPPFTSKQDYTVLKQQMDHILNLMKTISGLWENEESTPDE